MKEQRTLEVEWKAFELQPREFPLSPEQQAAKERMIEQSWPQLQAMAQQVYGLTLQRPRLGIDTRSAHVAAKAAERWGKGEAYHETLFVAYWQEGKDISDPGVLTSLAGGLGIDPGEFETALASRELLETVMQDQEESRRIGIRGVPATVIEGKYLLSGARPQQELLDILNRIENG